MADNSASPIAEFAARDLILVPDWPAPARVRALTTTRQFPGASLPPFDRCNLGARCGDDANAVASNRRSLAGLLALPAPPRWLRQVHGTGVAVFGQSESAAEPATISARAPSEAAAGMIGEAAISQDATGDDGVADAAICESATADAAIAHAAGVVLAILTADCLPLLACADDGSEVAAIHAGWRGLAAGAIERCVERMRTPRARLLVWLGPAIGPRSYEVGDEVRDVFMAGDAGTASAFVATRPGHWLCDLYALARRRLLLLGVRRIHGGDFDTLADARFYSHRRDRQTGRFASLVWIAG